MPNILVTGSNGQLGNDLRIISNQYPDYKFIFTDVEELNITDYQLLDKFFSENKIDFVINCAAYTAVDKAEQDEVMARFINVNAVKYLSQMCKKHNVFLIHISTDYVFDGHSYKPYIESDSINPVSMYGKTKADGEQEVIHQAGNAIIIRTSWLYSSFGNNFVKTILKYGKERGKLNVVFDQIGTPTYAADLAKAILDIIPKLNKTRAHAIYHYSNEGVTSWYDFAKEIIELSDINCIINAIETKDYPLPATRPQYSILNKTKIKQEFNITIPYWKDSLKRCLKLINEQNR
ncbi:MAG: dTDP-4-dehydrorhamnose reductase [Bacteroidota bacterium]